MASKQKTFSIMTNILPDDVYEILEKQARNRNLAFYITKLVQENQSLKDVIDRLERIEGKIDNIDSVSSTAKKIASTGDISLTEGKVIQADKVNGCMDQEDTADVDF